MQGKILGTSALTAFVLVLIMACAPWPANAQDIKTPYPSMASLDQYLMERNDEIVLARTAAPESISRDADVMVLGRHGYEVAVKGKNGFLCMVERSWTADIDDPDFWNPKLRAPICFNPPAARTYVPITVKKTDLVLAGKSKAQMFEGLNAAFDKKELPTLEPAAMCYMMSKQSNLGDAGHWHPHLMFLTPLADPATWGAGLPGSPVVVGDKNTQDRLNIFIVPVAKWSDGTADHEDSH